MATSSNLPWDRLKADTLRAICRDLGAHPGKRKREGMLEFLRAVETTGLDEALKLNIEDKDDTSPRRPSTKRARHTDEQAPPAAQAESSPEAAAAAGRPKRKAAPPPATEAPVKGRGKKAKTDATAPHPPVSKGKKSSAAEKKAAPAAGKAADEEQQEADEVDALADEPAENGAASSADQGAPDAPNAPESNVQTAVVIENQVEAAVITA